LPPGFTPTSCRSPIGWRCTTADKGFSWERVTGLVDAEDFDLTMQVASTPGTYVLPLSQTYDDGETRTFTGAPGTRNEAPLFTVTGAAEATSAPSPTHAATMHTAGPVPSATAAPTGAASAAGSPKASPSSPSTSPTVAAVTESQASDSGLDALPAGRRLEPPSSGGGPVALVALGFVALTILAGAILMVRRRQPLGKGPTA
jgi:hypothetical protein